MLVVVVVACKKLCHIVSMSSLVVCLVYMYSGVSIISISMIIGIVGAISAVEVIGVINVIISVTSIGSGISVISSISVKTRRIELWLLVVW